MSPLAALHEEIIACARCPRLVAWREGVAATKRRAFRDDVYWARPLPGFGDPNGRLLIVGLAPAAHGGNRTGRIFTGDSSGDFLMAALHRAGFANQPTSRSRDDGLELRDAFITAAVRCAPPANKPTPDEIRTCRAFLARETALLPNTRVVLALGRIAFDAIFDLWREQSLTASRPAFAHGLVLTLPPPWPTLVASYHPSRQNTQTGRLTPAMLDQVLARVRERLTD
ncbi:MAG: uracil-DNA glycosylase [Caldilineales bacterium]|nr:uracil-DNA glycosylase [Caldilineales bacterium]